MENITQHNRELIIDYLEAGSKGGNLGTVGVEMEHFLLDEDGDPVPYEEKHGRTGVRDILEKLSEFYPQVSSSSEGDIMGCSRAAASITIEPAAQIEVSLAPMSTVVAVEDEYRNFLFRLEQITKPLEYRVETVGYHPSSCAADLPLIPKQRYHFMDAYFAALPDMHAERMMRATASLQVSIDYADEADAVRKMRIATLLGPIFAAVADNCPVVEGKLNATPLARLRVWRSVDPARCGVVPGLFDEGFGFGAYADWLLATPPIFITRPDVHSTAGMTAAEAYGDAPTDEADIEHLLSMFWPDVRLKRYVEIRVADVLPIGPALGFVALIKGVFYGAANLDILEEFLGVKDDVWPYTADDVEEAIAAIERDGYEAQVYGRSVTQWFDLLFQMAPDGLGTEADYLDELKDFQAL